MNTSPTTPNDAAQTNYTNPVRRRIFNTILVGMLLSGLLAGCGAAQPGETAAPPPPTPVHATRAPLPTIIPSATRLPSDTPRPKLSPTPVFSPTPPTGMLSAPLVSSDNRWTALAVRLPAEGGQDTFELKVTHLTDGKTWVVDPLPSAKNVYPAPLRFSKDASSLYYTHRTNALPTCFQQSQNGGEGLFRLDLSTGKSQQLSDQAGTAFLALSPDGNTLALLNHTAINLTLVGVPGGSPRVLPAPVPLDTLTPPLDTGNLLWAPDSSQVVYLVYSGDCKDVKGPSTLMVSASVSGKQTELVPQNQLGLVPLRWTAEGWIIALDKAGVLWQIDPQTGKIEPIQVAPPGQATSETPNETPNSPPTSEAPPVPSATP